MNKILIVGHPQSGYSDVEKLLHACGMAPALPSRREGFAPEQISETLCKVHGAPPLHRLGNELDVQQIHVAPVWQSLAMDLMLGNLDQPLWGWADPKAVHLLEHWLALDPSLHFILVYDRPHSVLTRAGLQEAASLTRETVTQQLAAWSAYNAAVLAFHLRHPERCLLVHSEQVRRSAEASLQQVRARIDAPWKERIAGPGTNPALLAGTELEAAPSEKQATTLVEDLVLDGSGLATFVAGALLKDQPGSLALYEELQASANLPLAADLARGEEPTQGMTAWLSMVAQQEKLQIHRALARQLQAGRDQAEQLARDREDLLEQERQRRIYEQQDMAQQLATLQEELVRQQDKGRQIEELAPEGGAAVEALMAGTAPSKSDSALADENELLLNQLHQVQEELERYYLENKRLKTAQDTAPKPVALYGAADRVKGELGYRLGARMIANSRSVGGWMSLPWGLWREVREHRKAQRVNGGATLPALHLYRDAHEAERVKQHLSYRLGQALVRHGGSPLGWVQLPFALVREVKGFRAYRQSGSALR